ncbi:MAG: subclass B1 metallo-beta-lactamase, long type [Owenweeksia sp.]
MICCALTSAAQTIRISDELEVTQLTPAVYIHTCNTSNGVIFINRGEAIIVSTPPSDSATLALINWVTDSLKAKIVAYVIDRWHPDAMEGLDMVHLKDITSYSYTKTRQIAIQKGLPIPEITFDPRISLKAGSENVICHFLGEAHTSDGIVVWIPGEKVLFGGNEIRNLNGWAGNIADANLTEWSGSIKRARLMFREAKYVIPGHGPYGDKELMDYTIDLYNFDKNQKNPYRLNPDSLKVRDMMHQFDFRSYKREDLRDNRVAYTNGKINFRKDELDIEIHAPYFTYDMHNRELIIPAGFMSINREKEKQIERFKFDTLRLNLRNDAVGMTILIKSISKS